jgi:Tfp pilus assembly protein PilN
MKTRLNLATSPLEGDRRFVVGSATAGAVGVLLMLILAWHSYSAWRSNTLLAGQEQRLATDTAKLQAERRDLETFFNRPETVQRRDLAAFLNSLIAQRAFPWTRIFMDLERSLPSGARVVSVEPTLAGDHLELRFTVEAMSDEAKLQFLRVLENSSEFSQIQLLSERRSDRPGEDNPITLGLVARYSVT